MHADYVPNPLYDNNPFIEALPPMLSGKDLIRALAVIPPYSDSDRDRSTGERLQLLSSLYEFYQPLSMTIDLYCEIYTAMQHCYGQYSVQSEAAAFQNGYALMHGNALAASIGGGNSFSVIGVSGLGKSTALQRVLSLFPQVIEHTSYHGQNFYCHQIPYLVVQTPHDASIKALILDIYLQIDSLVGTSYQKDALSRRLSIDVLVSQLNQIVRVNHIGLLVIDELQNIAYRKSDGGIRFLNFLVHLINGAGVSICMVGTPRVLQVLQQEFRSARRTGRALRFSAPEASGFRPQTAAFRDKRSYPRLQMYSPCRESPPVPGRRRRGRPPHEKDRARRPACAQRACRCPRCKTAFRP